MSDRFKSASINAHRLSHKGSRLERVFVKHWQQQQQWSSMTESLLHALMRVPCGKDDEGAERDNFYTPRYVRWPMGKPTERDYVIAETVIQWLGSNVGQGFLHDVQREIESPELLEPDHD